MGAKDEPSKECFPGTGVPYPQLREGTHLMTGKHTNGDRRKSQTQKLAVLFPRPKVLEHAVFSQMGLVLP